MAKVTFDSSLAGIRGKLDGFVYREHYGQTVVMPHVSRDDKPSTAQLDRRERFRAAQAYAAAVLSDPLKRDCYRKLALARKCPPNALLVSNFLNPPVIEQADFSAYQGRPDDVIRVVATDAIEVIGVTVGLRSADGTLVEIGSALRDHDIWVYRCTRAHPAPLPSLRFEVTAQNRADAKVMRTFLLL